MKKWAIVLTSMMVACSSAMVWAESVDNPVSQMYYKKPSKYPGNWYLETGGAYSLQWVKFGTPSGQSALSKMSYREGTGVAFAEIGYAMDHNYTTPWRFSVSFLYRPDRKTTISPMSSGSSNSATAKVGTSQVMGNVYYDFFSKDQNSFLRQANLVPYIGLGVGWARNRTKFDVYATSGGASQAGGQGSSTKNQIAWDVVVGSSSQLFDQLWGNAFVRFSSLGKSTFQSGNGTEQATGRSWYALDVGLSLRYTFA